VHNIEEMTMDKEEIKYRQLACQYLIAPGDTQNVVSDLCGIQAQFMPNVLHGLKIRCRDFTPNILLNGFIKNWTLRGTMHVFCESDLPLFIHCDNGSTYCLNEWNEKSFWNQRDKWALTPERQAYFSDLIVRALESGNRSRDDLKALCCQHGMNDSECESLFDPWGGGIRELCQRGFMHYVPHEIKIFQKAPYFTPIPQRQAELEIARRYFMNFGPVTIHDAMYYFHTSASQVKAWLSQLPVQSCQCNGKNYYYIENSRYRNADIPECIFLSGFDSLMLGYEKKESLYLKPEYLRGIFCMSGIVMPGILLRGNIVGKWKEKNGILYISLFESISRSQRRIIEETALKLWSKLLKIIYD